MTSMKNPLIAPISSQESPWIKETFRIVEVKLSSLVFSITELS